MDRNGKIIAGCIAIDVWTREGLERDYRDHSDHDISQKIIPGGHIRLYFLSHLHADHTVGLNSSWSRGPIYTSPLNAKLASKVIPNLGVAQKLLVPLELNTSHLIPLGDSENDPKIRVTLIDANHVPGAVIFVFNGYFGNIVYTGDFRYTPSMLESSALKQLIAREDVDKVFLDNTYFFSECTFGCRSEVVEKVISFIKQHESHYFYIGANRLGKEDAFVKIAIDLNERICIDSDRLAIFQELELPDVFTLDPEKARIFIVNRNMITKKFLLSENQKRPTIGLWLTALFYNWEGNSPYQNCEVWDLNIFEYSDHSSYQEIIDFVAALKPKKIIPIVGSSKSNSNWLKRRKDFEQHRNDMSSLGPFLSTLPTKTFGYSKPKIVGLPNIARDASRGEEICKNPGKMLAKPTPRRIYRGPKGAIYDSSTTVKTDSTNIASDHSKLINESTNNIAIKDPTSDKFSKKSEEQVLPIPSIPQSCFKNGEQNKKNRKRQKSFPVEQMGRDDEPSRLLQNKNREEQAHIDSRDGGCLKVVKISENKDEKICFVDTTPKKRHDYKSTNNCMLKKDTNNLTKGNRLDKLNVENEIENNPTEEVVPDDIKNHSSIAQNGIVSTSETNYTNNTKVEEASKTISECANTILKKRFKQHIDENDFSVLHTIDQNLSKAQIILENLSTHDLKE